jgi:hypothetical protein
MAGLEARSFGHEIVVIDGLVDGGMLRGGWSDDSAETSDQDASAAPSSSRSRAPCGTRASRDGNAARAQAPPSSSIVDPHASSVSRSITAAAALLVGVK